MSDNFPNEIPVTEPAPPAPEWIPAPHPWAVDAPTAQTWVSEPPAAQPWLTDAPAAQPWFAGAPPPPPLWPPSQRPPAAPWPSGPVTPGAPPAPAPRSHGAFATFIAAIAVLAALVGLAFGSRLHLHGVRPTLSASPATAPDSPLPPTATDPTNGPRSIDPNNPLTNTAPSSTGSAVSPSAAALANKVDPGIVDVNSVLGYQGAAGAGTGMILTSSGEILTNNHVIDGATSISVTLVSTGRTYRATVVGTDPTQDIAVLQINDAPHLQPVATGTSSPVAVGDAVVAIGNAGGVGGAPAVVSGTVEAVNQTITASDPGGANAETLNGLIQTNAPIQPGDSGGPLVNTTGQVIGIDTAASSARRTASAPHIGFAIPIAQALDIAHQIEGGQQSATIHIGLPGFLGVAIAPPSALAAPGATRTAPAGALVAGVTPNLPAASAGLAAGDTITSINGSPVDSAAALSPLTKSHHPGDRITVGWTTQSGRTRTASIKLATGPAD